MGLSSFYTKVASKLDNAKFLPLIIIRLMLAYGFYGPAMSKLKGIQGIADWFSSMGYPFPLFNAYLVTAAEALGVILLALGLGTRIISIPLMIVMIVAIFTVHYSNGFAAGDNGIEIPLYYFIMLLTLLIFGSGKMSIDHLISRKRK